MGIPGSEIRGERKNDQKKNSINFPEVKDMCFQINVCTKGIKSYTTLIYRHWATSNKLYMHLPLDQAITV